MHFLVYDTLKYTLIFVISDCGLLKFFPKQMTQSSILNLHRCVLRTE